MNTVNFEDMPVSASIQAGDDVLVNQNDLSWLVEYAGWWPTKGEDYQKHTFAAVAPGSWKSAWRNDNAV